MRRALASALTAVAIASAGCSDDIATVSKGKFASCLTERGVNPRPFLATSAHSPREYGALLRENGARGGLAVLGRAPRIRDAWAYVFFFNGSERAKAVYGRLTGDRGKVKIGNRTVASTRRQNAIVLYGRKPVYGRTAGPADRNVLETCFDKAS